MINWWFGLLVWIFGIPLYKGFLLSGTPRIPNHRAPNHQFTFGWTNHDPFQNPMVSMGPPPHSQPDVAVPSWHGRHGWYGLPSVQFGRCLWRSQRMFGNIHATVDGRNPAPPGMHETHWNPVNNKIFTISTGAGFLPSTIGGGFIFYVQIVIGFLRRGGESRILP